MITFENLLFVLGCLLIVYLMYRIDKFLKAEFKRLTEEKNQLIKENAEWRQSLLDMKERRAERDKHYAENSTHPLAGHTCKDCCRPVPKCTCLD